MFRTSNPVLKEKTFAGSAAGSEAMTIQGTVNKTIILLALAVIGAAWTWNLAFNHGLQAVLPYLAPCAIGGFIIAMVTIFANRLAPATAPAYAVIEGLFLGGVSALLEARYPGIVLQAVALTFGTLFCLLMAYKSRLIKVTRNFRLGVVAATGAIALVYLASWIGGMFGWQMPYIHDGGPIGIGVSVVIVTIAALNLVLDFDFIERAHGKAPKYMEWVGAFGLLVTLVWLYLEILRLLSKLRNN